MSTEDRPTTTALLSRRAMMQAGAAGVAVAAASSLAGCTGGGGGAKGKLSATGKPVKGGPKTTPNADVLYPPGYVGPIASHKGPITTERATLTVVVPEDVQLGDWSKNEFTAWYEKRTNVHVNFKTVAGTSAPERMTKVNAIISAGDLPDAFMGMGFSSSQLQLYGHDQKLFAPLNDIIDTYCPETKRIFKDYPDARAAYTSPDSKIYQMPSINDCYHCKALQDRAWIYQPWLDELGLKMPTNLDEFEEVLKAFKTKDPNHNGRHDEIAFTTSKDGNGNPTTFDQFIMGSFLYNPGNPWLVLDNGKVDVVFNKPGWRDGMTYLNRLYSQGLIPKEAFTQSNEQLMRQGNAKQVVLGVVRQPNPLNFLTIDATAKHPRFLEYVAVPALKGPNGVQTAAWDYYYPYGAGSYVVTTASKIPAIAAMWADGQYELEAILRAITGPTPKYWRWAKKGEVGFTGTQAVYWRSSDWPADPGKSWIQDGVTYRSLDYRNGQVSDPKHPSSEEWYYSNTKRACYPYRQQERLELPHNLAMSEDDAGTIADLGTTINNYVVQQQVKFTMGQADPTDDKAWNNYLGTLNQMKLDTYLSIYQKAYENAPR